MQQQKQKFFYGWWVVLALMLVTGTSLALVVSTFNIYLNPVSEALGISKTQFALCSTIINLAVLVAAPKLGGWLQQNTRKVLLLCLFGFYAAYAAFAWVNSLAALYVWRRCLVCFQLAQPWCPPAFWSTVGLWRAKAWP